MIKNYDDLIKKIETVTKTGKVDLSSDEDLSIAIMNLISIEEHLFFTAQKTEKPQYLDILNEVRGMRTELLKKIIKDYEGEVWCISKHLLTAAMRLMETGTKQLDAGNREEAKSLFGKSYRLYLLFWEVNSGVIYSGKAKEEMVVSEKITGEEKFEGEKSPQEETSDKEKIVFVPVCKETL
jgi:hypothetical protein